MAYLKTLCALIIIGPALDFLWFSIIASDFYKKRIGSFLRMSENGVSPAIPATALVYVAIAFLVVFFVLPKVASSQGLMVFVWGALFGFLAYSFYDMTNLALFKNWSLAVSLVDILWGAVFLGSLTVIGHYLMRYFS